MPHATVHPTVTHGTSVVVDCPSPFILVGNPRPTCTNGTFTDVPACVIRDEFDISGGWFDLYGMYTCIVRCVLFDRLDLHVPLSLDNSIFPFTILQLNIKN